MLQRIQNQNGMSLVSAVVAGAVGFIIMGSMMMMQLNQIKQNKGLEQKLEAIQVEQTLTRILADKNTCECIFKDKQSITLASDTTHVDNVTIKNGCSDTDFLKKDEAISSSRTNLRVSSIDLKNVKKTAPNTFLADLQIGFDAGSFAGPMLKPLTVTQMFKTDGADKVIECVNATTSDKAALCLSISGTWDSTTEKCSTNTVSADLQAACVSVNGVWNSVTSKCSLPKSPGGAIMPKDYAETFDGLKIPCPDSCSGNIELKNEGDKLVAYARGSGWVKRKIGSFDSITGEYTDIPYSPWFNGIASPNDSELSRKVQITPMGLVIDRVCKGGPLAEGTDFSVYSIPRACPPTILNFK